MFSQTEVAPGVINFAVGVPGKSLIPKNELDEAVAAATAANSDAFMYQYAKIEGTQAFRASVAALLRANGLTHVGSENICATFGNSLGLATLAKIFARPCQCVVVEEPTYFLAGKVFDDAGLRCVRIGVDGGGIQVDVLEAWLKSSKTKPAFVYCIPRHHNPTSVCLDAARETRLLALADEYDFMVVFDDPYRLLLYSNLSPAAAAAPAEAAAAAAGVSEQALVHRRVLSLGSFSKILTPGLRLGWVIAAAENIKRICEDGALNSGGGPPNVITEAVRLLIDSGKLQQHIARVREELGARAAALARAVQTHFKGRLSCRECGGGYFMYLEVLQESGGVGGTALPPCFSTAGFRSYCDDAAAGVGFMPGSRCTVTNAVSPGEAEFGLLPTFGGGGGGSHSNISRPCIDARYGMRLSVSYYETADIEEGVRRLAVALDAYLLLLSS